MGRKAKIGLIQVNVEQDFKISIEDKLENLYLLGRECLSQGAELIFFPEAYQYVNNGEILKDDTLLQEISTHWKARCAELAKKYHSYVVPWDYELDVNGSKYNTSYILDRTGQEIGRFRKVHLTYGEQMWGLKNGADFPVFDLDFGRVGIMICFDNYWPESARVLGLRGAELILYPLYGDTLTPQWELKMRVRAIDNNLYIASCQLANQYNISYTGLVNPKGDVVCKLDTPSSCKVVEVDMGRPVITSTGGNPEFAENLARYLERCRNVAAYKPLLEQTIAWEWEDIFLGNRPLG